MWNTYVAIIQITNAGRGNAWKPQPGSREHKLAEKMVDKGWLSREHLAHMCTFNHGLWRSDDRDGGWS